MTEDTQPIATALLVTSNSADTLAVRLPSDGGWARLLCEVCEETYEPTGFAAPVTFTCDGCGTVNGVVTDAK